MRDIKAFLFELKNNRSLPATLQTYLGWAVARCFEKKSPLADRFKDHVRSGSTLPGPFKQYVFPLPITDDAAVRLMLNKLGYELGRTIALREFFSWIAVQMATDDSLKSGYVDSLKEQLKHGT